MSGETESECAAPIKDWDSYRKKELHTYIFRNAHKADCSFIAKDHNNKEKVVKTFKWILMDLSPVFRTIFNEEINRAKNCKEILISDPQYIEAIVHYGHMKFVENTDISNWFDLFKIAVKYQIHSFEKYIIEIIQYDSQIRNSINWVELFWMTYIKYPNTDQQMINFYHYVVKYLGSNSTDLMAQIELILSFEKENFDTFLEQIRCYFPLKAFQILEIYLAKHFFNGEITKPFEEFDSLEQAVVEVYLEEINLNQTKLNDILNGPFKSKLCGLDFKKKTLKNVRKYGSSGPEIQKEIDLHLKELEGM